MTFKYPATGAIALAVTTTSLPDGTDREIYSEILEASGGVTTYSWSVTSGSLPAGLTLSGNTILGTPTTVETQAFTVMVTDSDSPTASTDSVALSITIGDVPVVPPPGSVSLLPIAYSGAGGKNNNVHLLINVGLSEAIADVAVAVTVYRDGHPYGSATGATDSSGVAHFRANRAPAGRYTTVVNSVTGADWDEVPAVDPGIGWP